LRSARSTLGRGAEDDDRNFAGAGCRLQVLQKLEARQLRQSQIHQDHIALMLLNQSQGACAI
jgi:hypothetical protein